jgi:hypothetical protein
MCPSSLKAQPSLSAPAQIMAVKWPVTPVPFWQPSVKSVGLGMQSFTSLNQALTEGVALAVAEVQ